MTRLITRGLVCSALVAAPPSFAWGQAPAGGSPGYASLVWENDAFSLSHTDGHYTNGLRLSYLSGEDRIWHWLAKTAKSSPLFPSDAKLRASFAVGHNMYTPEDISDPDPIPDDRPYAAWLYGALGLVGENGRNLDLAELSLGIVGPAAGGEEFQRFIHEIIGSPEPQGWHNQLSNEVIIQAYYEHLWRGLQLFKSASLLEKLGTEFDAVPHLAGALGNAYIFGAGGLTLRVGNDLSADYGPPRIQPSLPGSGIFATSRMVGWLLFVGFEARAVAHNLFLDGNTFKQSLSVEKHPFVGDLQLGAALVVARTVRFAFTYVVRSKEFTAQRRPDQFGALSLSLRF